jgi:S-DNA-T family DNA segregation ATPase FtsK/SpoIIIE
MCKFWDTVPEPLLWLLALLALASYSPADASFTTSGLDGRADNWVGRLGAWAADMASFLFGFSAWWLVPVALRAWLSALAGLLRAEVPASDIPAQAPARWPFWLGLALLLAASTALEWTRLYRWEEAVPGGHAGGVLGYVLGSSSMLWLGFAGSGVLWIALGVLGASLALRFSWVRLADGIGLYIDAWRERRQGRAEQAQDRRLGEEALREREQVVEVQRQVQEEHLPLLIEPARAELPISQRVVKERQKPLFAELLDTRLPQVDLLDHRLLVHRILDVERDLLDDRPPALLAHREHARDGRHELGRRRLGRLGGGGHQERGPRGDGCQRDGQREDRRDPPAR